MARIAVARYAGVPERIPHKVEVNGHPIVLCKLDGEVFALDDTCTHENESLSEGEIWDDLIECPKHGAQFDIRTGAVASMPAVVPEQTYPVMIDADQVYLDL